MLDFRVRVVGNQLEQDIIQLYNRDITSLYSINQIAMLLKKAYPYINKKVNSLLKQKILKKTIIGRSHLCSINLENEEAVFLLILNEVQKKKHLPKEWLAQLSIVDELKKHISMHVALKVSNQLIFVLENPEDQKILEKSASLKSFKFKVYSKEEFLKSLVSDKNILQNHVIISGFENYYNYLKEVEDQIRIRHSKLLQ